MRVPYYFAVQYPQIGRAPRVTIKRDQLGDTSKGVNHVSAYRFPSWPFGPPPSYTGKAFNEDGAERVYTVRVSEHAVNAGVAVVAAGDRRARSSRGSSARWTRTTCRATRARPST